MSEGLVLGLRLLGSLIVVVGLAVIVTRYLLPRLMVAGGRRGGRLEVLEVRAIDRQHKVALLQVAGRQVLAAFGPGGVARLDAWEGGGPDAEDSVVEGTGDSASGDGRRLRSLP
ncbi:MAG: flagellar biosynthetic protein FliO [Acidobacteriota bacterium]